MSENSVNENIRSLLSRKIGAGLTRTSLSPRSGAPVQRLSKDTPLLTPSRVIISGSNLGAHRTQSDRLASGYDRLGGKYVSAPNVNAGSTKKSSVDVIKPVQKDDDVNQSRESPSGRDLSDKSKFLSLQDDPLGITTNVHRSQYASRGHGYPVTERQTHSWYGDTSTTPRKTSDQHYQRAKLENFDLDLEQDEEDADNVKVKDTGNNISPNSPGKDSGYYSPRLETNVDSFSTSVQRSRSLGKSEGLTIISSEMTPNNFKTAPERPARSKTSARKQSVESAKELSPLTHKQSPWQQDQNSQAVNTVVGIQNYDVPRNNISSANETKNLSTSSQDSQRSGDEGEEGPTPSPIARPRTHRRLTRRAFSFRRLEEDEYIGFASLPEQVHRKAVRRGFEFTLMVVGETGLGKSTLINSLFLMDLYKDRVVGTIEERIQKTVELEKKELEIEERGVKLKLTIVDTPGFNDAVNAEQSWKPILDYIDDQFDAYFTAESGLNRKNIQDTRVHCCLYFISPYGHGLRPVDVMVMKKLHHKVNIIPLLAKADMLTKQEVKRLKDKVLEEIQKHKIDIYQYPDCDSDEDEEFKLQDQELKKSIPFAVVGSNTVVEAGGKKVRGRMYPWGIVEVENPLHSDFTKLRQMLISTHMQDLKDVTCDVHYENYRAEHISEQMSSSQRERGKLKRDSVANLEKTVETEKLLQEKDAEIKRMQEMLMKMQAQLQTNGPRSNGRVGHV